MISFSLNLASFSITFYLNLEFSYKKSYRAPKGLTPWHQTLYAHIGILGVFQTTARWNVVFIYIQLFYLVPLKL